VTDSLSAALLRDLIEIALLERHTAVRPFSVTFSASRCAGGSLLSGVSEVCLDCISRRRRVGQQVDVHLVSTPLSPLVP
jgi:hypothetical protein